MISIKEAQEFAQNYGYLYIETSAKNNISAADQDIFTTLAKLIYLNESTEKLG